MPYELYVLYEVWQKSGKELVSRSEPVCSAELVTRFFAHRSIQVECGKGNANLTAPGVDLRGAARLARHGSRLVSFVDTDGIRHSVELQAESLYEAVVLAVRTFRQPDCGPGEISKLESRSGARLLTKSQRDSLCRPRIKQARRFISLLACKRPG